MNGCVIPHTPIAVDCWQRRLVHAKICFLTHMHTDHTQGLTSSWDQPIYCSEITRSLAIEHLNIKPCFLISIPVGQSTIIPLDDAGVETMTVTLIDANHCAGAVMLLFQGYFGCILHTGDFRYFNGMLDVPPFTKDIVINTLYLDNTYCDPRCEFPSRAEAIKKILNIIHDNPGKEVRIGLDKLGKEELLFEIAKDQGVPIFVEEKLRLEVAELLAHSGFFTRSQEDTYIKVFSRRSVNRRALMDLNRNVRPTIGILPSALYIGRANPFAESDEIFVVPYSDHSSFSELKAFVAKLRPERIIPVVRKNGRKDEDSPDRSDMTIFANEMSSNAGPHIFDIPPTVREFMSGSSNNNRNTPSVKRKASTSYFNSRSKRPCGIVFSPEKQTAACVETDKVAVQEEANTSNQPHEDKDVVNQHRLPVDETSKMLQEERASFDEEMSAKSLGDNEVDRSPGSPKQGKFSESQNLKLSGTPSKRVLQLKQSIIEHIQRMVESPSAVAVNPKEPREHASAVELPKDTEISFNKRNTDEINILPQSGNELQQKRDDDSPNLPEIEANKKSELPVNLDQPSEMQSELSSTEHTEALSDPNFTSCGSQTTSNDPETCDPLATVPRNSSIELGRHSEGIVENTSISKKTSNQCNPLEADVSVSESEKVFEPQANEAENILGKSEPQLVQQDVQSDVCNPPIGNDARNENGESKMVNLDQPGEMQSGLSSTEHTELLNNSNFTSCGSQTRSNDSETRDPLATMRRNSSIELGRHSEGIVEDTSISTKTSNQYNLLEADVSVSESEKIVEFQANEPENILGKSEPQLVQQGVQSDVCNSPINEDSKMAAGDFQFPDNSSPVVHSKPDDLTRDTVEHQSQPGLQDSLKALTNGKIGVAKTNRKNDLPLNEICSAQKLDKAASNGDYLKVSQKVDSLNAEQRKQHNLDDVFSSEEAKQQTLNDSLTEVFASRGEKSTEKSEGLGIRIAEEEKLHTLNDNTTQVLGEQTVTLNKEVSREQKANESLTWHDLKGLPADEKRKLETLNELNRAQVCEPENNKNGEQCKLNMVSGTRDFSSRSEDNVTNEEELAVPVPEANMQLILRVLDSQEGAKTSIRVLEKDDIGLATLDRFCNVKDSEGCDSKDIDVYLRILNKTGRPLGIEVDSTEQLVGNLTSSGSTQVHCLTSQALQETSAEFVQRQPISNPAPNSRKKRRKLTGIYREILSRKPTRTSDNYPK